MGPAHRPLGQRRPSRRQAGAAAASAAVSAGRSRRAAPAARPAGLDAGAHRRLRRRHHGARRVPHVPRDRRAAAQHLRFDRNRTADLPPGRAFRPGNRRPLDGIAAGAECAAAVACQRGRRTAGARRQPVPRLLPPRRFGRKQAAGWLVPDRGRSHQDRTRRARVSGAPVGPEAPAFGRVSRRSSSRRGCASAPSSRTS